MLVHQRVTLLMFHFPAGDPSGADEIPTGEISGRSIHFHDSFSGKRVANININGG